MFMQLSPCQALEGGEQRKTRQFGNSWMSMNLTNLLHFCEGGIVIALNGRQCKSVRFSEAQQLWQVHHGNIWTQRQWWVGKCGAQGFCEPYVKKRYAQFLVDIQLRDNAGGFCRSVHQVAYRIIKWLLRGFIFFILYIHWHLCIQLITALVQFWPQPTNQLNTLPLKINDWPFQHQHESAPSLAVVNDLIK